MTSRVPSAPQIYLDHNATALMLPEVADAIAHCFRLGYANPASQHQAGRQARRVLEDCRECIAHLLGARQSPPSDQMIFTSGGTEANNLALFGLLQDTQRPVLVSAIEHPSVLRAAERLQRQGIPVLHLRALPSGVVDLDHLDQLLDQPDNRRLPQLVSVMLGNNETGVLQPVQEICRRCQPLAIRVHTDAAQVLGKLPVDFHALGVAALSFAAHKFHGPCGIGGLLVRADCPVKPLLFGGAQQLGLRPGTEPVALAVGMCQALRLWHEEADQRPVRLARLRDRFEARLKANDPLIAVNGSEAPRLPNTSNLAFVGLDRQALVIALDLEGICCSTGTACSSGSSEPSHVLKAMGRPAAVVAGTLRFSLGCRTQEWEIDDAVERILHVVNRLRQKFSCRTTGIASRELEAKSV